MPTTRVSILGVLLVCLTCVPGGALAEDVPTREFPLLVLTCETDPGPVDPGGGRALMPGELEGEFGCVPAEGVGVTVTSAELGFQARCDTDVTGNCVVVTPSGLEHELHVAVHTAMLPPGFEPREPVLVTHNYTEFAGAGIVALPVETQHGRRVLELAATGCDQGPCTADDLIAQVSAGGITSRDAAWLATNDAGIVTFDLGALDADTVDLMFGREGQPEMTCRAPETGEDVPVEWLDLTEGSVYRFPITVLGDIHCDADFSAV